ncbi:MAG TPA: acyltransferase [Thermoanaerobaculia bacterium]
MLRGLSITLMLLVNLLLWGTPVLLGGVVKFFTFGPIRRKVIVFLTSLGDRWAAGNDRIFDSMLSTRWEIAGVDGLRRDGRYLIVSNHVSWVDIFAVFRAFHGRTPFIRFFLKQELIWFPIVGQACWALDFPFMRRYTPEYLERHPEKRGTDLETTRIACRRYRKIPVTILNYVEGTRFSRDKHEDQQSPYRYLLRPRPGGVSFVLASLGEQLDGVIDVTIVYPKHDVTMWSFVTNRVPRIVVDARLLDVPPEFFSPAITEAGQARERFKVWLEEVWREKDARIARMLEPPTFS